MQSVPLHPFYWKPLQTERSKSAETPGKVLILDLLHACSIHVPESSLTNVSEALLCNRLCIRESPSSLTTKSGKLDTAGCAQLGTSLIQSDLLEIVMSTHSHQDPHTHTHPSPSTTSSCSNYERSQGQLLLPIGKVLSKCHETSEQSRSR